MRRLLAVFAALGVLLAGVFIAPTAHAQVTGFGTVSSFYGWNYNHTSCDIGPNTNFFYQGFRATASTVQFRFQAEQDGVMRIQIDAPGGESHDYHILGDADNLQAPIYYVNWAAKLRYYFWMVWKPAAVGPGAVSGQCVVRFPVG